MINSTPESQIEVLTANLAEVRTRIAQAAQRAGRSPNEITLIAVSKTKPLEMVKIAYNLGVTNFGENRVQEAQLKIEAFKPEEVRWHMLGHVQTNKANKVVSAFDSVQSVDSLHLAQELNQQAQKQGKRLAILLEVNVAGEASKTGVLLAEVTTLARHLVHLPALEVQGLMTVAPQATNPEEVRPVFRALRELRMRLQAELPQASWQQLSMGMTDDYPIAIEEGSTIVRIGRAIFGERMPKLSEMNEGEK